MRIPELWEALQVVLQESALEWGQRSGWQQRRGRITAAQFVQTLVWGWLADPHASLGQLTRMAHTTGALVTAQAISQRFSSRSVALLRGVLRDAFAVAVAAAPLDVALLQRFPGGVYLNDTTQLPLPDDWHATWDGGGIAAALKIPVVLDLMHGTLQAELVPARQHDTKTSLANLTFPPESVVIEDLGYLDLDRMQRRQEHGVATLVPLRCTLAVADAQGRRIQVHAWLNRHPNEVVERTVLIHGQWLRLVALPASAATTARKQQGIRQSARKHGRVPNPTALALAAWIIVLTTVPPEQATSHQIGTLMRLRWQIELVFKLWKDQGKLDETRGWNPERIETEWYAKLLGVLLQHWILVTTSWQQVDRSWTKVGAAIREEARTLCWVWQDGARLTAVCERIARSVAVTGRVTSHDRQRSTASLLLAP